MRERSRLPEILDGGEIPDDVRERCYRDLARTHRYLGNHALILRSLRRNREPVRSVLDIGCARGALLHEIRAKLGVHAIGVDLNPPSYPLAVTIVRADAVRDPLPAADVAISLAMVHHLAEEDFIRLIRNVGRVCRRFLILDLVRHPLPRALFRIFVAPFIDWITAQDGIRSLERAFTPREMRRLVSEALAGTGARFRHTVAPLYIRQVVDIRYT